MMKNDPRWDIWNRIDEFWAECYEKFGWEDPIVGWIADQFDKQSGMIFLCEEMGHYWVDDHCGKPEHQFCGCCKQLIDEESLQKQKNNKENI